jgi:hypothetical protein
MGKWRREANEYEYFVSSVGSEYEYLRYSPSTR